MKTMIAPLSAILAAATLTACDVKVDNSDPPASKTTVVTPEKKVEHNTTIVTPAKEEKKVENNTTIVNPPAEKKIEKKEETTIINPPR